MIDNEIKNEIKKALGYCLGDECHTSECCFFDEAKNDEHCYIVAIRYAFDYINRLEAEIKQYAKEQHELMIEKDKLFDVAEKQKAEIEKLRKSGLLKEGFFNLLCGALVYTNTIEEYNEFRRTIKAEAYKEFAERLRKKVKGLLVVNYIDELLKEMDGEQYGDNI